MFSIYCNSKKFQRLKKHPKVSQMKGVSITMCYAWRYPIYFIGTNLNPSPAISTMPTPGYTICMPPTGILFFAA